MKPLADFHVALTFLTRLGRARLVSPADISGSMSMYPLVGALIGLILALASFAPLSPAVLAWILTGLNLYVTRGLHWDGWADLWDGWGSGTVGERFWSIVKDSRTGAFGVMGLVLGLGLQSALFERALAKGAWTALIWAPVFGRFCCLVLARWGRGLARPGLGQNAAHGATSRALFGAGATTLLAGCLVPWPQAAATVVLAVFPLVALIRLGRRQNGLNGDFLGAAIIAGELCALLSLCLVSDSVQAIF
ncbi:MAG: adenosylcobinamide-GDP ribazoletransferase [Desulfovibrionales bacterium]|nr:adenosylcobinamide-GDP ribazoletransferase [Desulfovibrionales bacterium]